jgi:thiosulfate dehydrogenase [quinone] large subunit
MGGLLYNGIIMDSQSSSAKLVSRIAILRIGFGLIWAFDAVLKFEPAFRNGILTKVKAADTGVASWLNWWFDEWYKLIGLNSHAFAIAIIVIESLLAILLLTGVYRRFTYSFGAIFSFLIWSVAEGFGGPYVAGSTDPGAGIIYVLAFLMLYVSDRSASPSYSLQPWLDRKLPKLSFNNKSKKNLKNKSTNLSSL